MILVLGADGRIQVPSVQYDGSKGGDDLTKWLTYTPDPHEFIRLTYGDIQARAATLYNTSPLCRAAVLKPTSYAVGDGLLFRSHIDAAFLDMDPDEAKEWSRKFTKLIHMEKVRQNFYRKQRLLFQEAKIGGDSILYFLRDGHGGVDLIEAGGHEIDWRAQGADYTLGVRHDEYGRRIGIKNNAGKEIPFRDPDGNQNVIQYYVPDRARQLRGYPAVFPIIGILKQVDRWKDALTAAMVNESIILGTVADSLADAGEQAAAMARTLARQAKGEAPVKKPENEVRKMTARLEPGAMFQLSTNGKMEFMDKKTPGGQYAAACREAVRDVAMAVGYPPEFLIGEYSTSFTAHKGALNDAWRRIRSERAEFLKTVDWQVNREFLRMFVRSGEINVKSNFWTSPYAEAAYLGGSYLGPVPGHVNPLQEIRADIEAVQSGAMLRSDMAAKFGHDLGDIIDEWEDQERRFRSASAEEQEESIRQDLEQK